MNSSIWYHLDYLGLTELNFAQFENERMLDCTEYYSSIGELISEVVSFSLQRLNEMAH